MASEGTSLLSGIWRPLFRCHIDEVFSLVPQTRFPLLSAYKGRRTYKSTPKFLKDKSSSNSLHAWPPCISFHTARFLPQEIGDSHTAPDGVAPFSSCIRTLIWSCVSCVIVRERFSDGEGVPRHVLKLSLLTSLDSTQSSSVATLAIGESKQAVIIVA